MLERQGKPLALGVVLDGDGRILTALSPLTNGNFLSARYADGVVTPLKLVHSDRGWDLALLSAIPGPKQQPHKSGLRAARTPSFVGLQTFNLAPPNTVATAPAALKLSEGLLGGDNTALVGAYELGQKAALVGGPIVNAEGEVVAVVARACPPKSNAAYVAYKAVRAWVKQDTTRPVPMHLRNAPTKLMKQLGHGDGYRYAHDEPDAVAAGATNVRALVVPCATPASVAAPLPLSVLTWPQPNDICHGPVSYMIDAAHLRLSLAWPV